MGTCCITMILSNRADILLSNFYKSTLTLHVCQYQILSSNIIEIASYYFNCFVIFTDTAKCFLFFHPLNTTQIWPLFLVKLPKPIIIGLRSFSQQCSGLLERRLSLYCELYSLYLDGNPCICCDCSIRGKESKMSCEQLLYLRLYLKPTHFDESRNNPNFTVLSPFLLPLVY